MIFKEVKKGYLTIFPILIGVFPFGLIYGVLGISAGMSPAETQGMSVIIFAGSSQFLATQMVSEAVPGMLMVISIAVVNLRHMLYSASIAPYFQGLSNWRKVILSYFLTDEAFSVAIIRFTNDGKNASVNGSLNLRGRVSFFFGAGVGLCSTWQISTLAGIYVGEIIPASWSLDFALPLTLIALVVPVINTNSKAMAALAAGTAAVFLYWMPYYSGLIVASMIGIFTGMVIERRE